MQQSTQRSAEVCVLCEALCEQGGRHGAPGPACGLRSLSELARGGSFRAVCHPGQRSSQGQPVGRSREELPSHGCETGTTAPQRPTAGVIDTPSLLLGAAALAVRAMRPASSRTHVRLPNNGSPRRGRTQVLLMPSYSYEFSTRYNRFASGSLEELHAVVWHRLGIRLPVMPQPADAAAVGRSVRILHPQHMWVHGRAGIVQHPVMLLGPTWRVRVWSDGGVLAMYTAAELREAVTMGHFELTYMTRARAHANW